MSTIAKEIDRLSAINHELADRAGHERRGRLAAEDRIAELEKDFIYACEVLGMIADGYGKATVIAERCLAEPAKSEPSP